MIFQENRISWKLPLYWKKNIVGASRKVDDDKKKFRADVDVIDRSSLRLVEVGSTATKKRRRRLKGDGSGTTI